jgi:hypothetical protein
MTAADTSLRGDCSPTSSSTLTDVKRVVCLLSFFFLISCTYLKWYVHHFRLFTLEDSGLFLHIGQRLIHGDRLYRDIWDNKPPIIHWLNALGLLLGRGSPGGVLLLCTIAGLLTFVVLYWGLRPYVGWQMLIITGCLAQLAFLTCAVHPNYTEAFAMPLAALAAVLFVRELLDGKRIPSRWLIQGAVAALLFSLRPNNVGISIIYALYILISWRSGIAAKQLLLFSAGAGAVYALILTPLLLQGVLREYLSAALQLAGSYAQENSLAARIRALGGGVNVFGSSPLLYFSVACGLTVMLSRHKTRTSYLVLWLTGWLVVEMVLSSASGYHWTHYFLSWILPMAILMMVAGSELFQGKLTPTLPVLLAVSLELVVLNQAAVESYRAWKNPQPESAALVLARQYVRDGDRVTTWGYYDHSLWFDLNHQPGTRLFHEGGYTNRNIYEALVPTFLSDLEQNRPRIVIERPSAVPLFAPPDPQKPLNEAFPPKYFTDWDTPPITKRKAALAQVYQAVAEQSGLVVYLRRE